MKQYAIICRNTWQVLQYVDAANHRQAQAMGQNLFHSNVVAVLPEDTDSALD